MGVFTKKHIIAPGLYLKQDEEGYWDIWQEKPQSIVMSLEKEEEAKMVANTLKNMGEWDKEDDFVRYIQEKIPPKYQYFSELKTKHHVSKRKNFLYRETMSSNGEVRYMVLEGGKDRHVKGELIVDGLGIHQRKDGLWALDHIATGTILTKFHSYEEVRVFADAVSSYLDWENTQVLDLFVNIPKLSQFFKEVKGDIEKKSSPRVMPDILQFQVLFAQNEDISERWKVFERSWNDLQQMVGLSEVKYEIKRLIEQLRGSLRNRGKVKKRKARLHMMFTGAPGTGKTQVARIVSKLLYSLGYLEKNVCNEVDRSSIVGTHIGETEQRMKSIIKKSMGGVLFIDEAYALAKESERDFGQEAIDVLIKAMEDHKDSFVVILAGYTVEMKKLMKMNTGFESRIAQVFSFQDFTPDELLDISLRMLSSYGYRIGEEAKFLLLKEIKSKAKKGMMSGNARSVEKMVDRIIDELNIRIGKQPGLKETTLISPDDVEKALDKNKDSEEQQGLKSVRDEAYDELQSLIGLDEVKTEVKRMLNRLTIQKQKEQKGITSDRARLHMVFMGPPGTAKTTVARIIGKFLKGAGILSNGQFVEVSRSDLVGKYQGHTATNTKAKVEEAMGGILFIDEAYSLHGGEYDSFGKEAIAELIACMENYKDNLVVILAGYEKEMDEMIDLNPGFRSRIGFSFPFENYTTSDIVDISKHLIKKNNLQISGEEEQVLSDCIQQYAEKQNGHFEGNGRWSSNFVRYIEDAQMERLSMSSKEEIPEEELICVLKEDIKEAIKRMR
ncbi:AAA family ATPase (plasmid) [Pontibacillus sp. ALD_SL1]|uniref:AAA family ATPase n=1 Tax=Pontibacillus sp. ALD_SL1 TaxID=2777185 RepID=UPI001A971E12|nr:AAA family ATPase [Pontibacillus sp. ALD_SL1]QST02040.1 AAA family ATPase [Pontibacillus sp. ALD_SL1]